MINQSIVKDTFAYKDGQLIHLKWRPGTIAGTTDKTTGYKRVCINRKFYYAHRVIWLYFNGNMPDGEIDHIDGVRTNNKIENLRDVNHSINCQNQKKLRPNNTTGFVGVHFYKSRNNYTAQIVVNYKVIRLGYFKTAEEANCAYKASKLLHHHK